MNEAENTPTSRPWVRRLDAAAALGISEHTLDRWAREGRIAPVETKRPGVWYRAEDLIEMGAPMGALPS